MREKKKKKAKHTRRLWPPAARRAQGKAEAGRLAGLLAQAAGAVPTLVLVTDGFVLSRVIVRGRNPAPELANSGYGGVLTVAGPVLALAWCAVR